MCQIKDGQEINRQQQQRTFKKKEKFAQDLLSIWSIFGEFVVQRGAGRGRLAEKATPVVTALLFNIKQEQLSLKKVKVKKETKNYF